ncbi:MAG: hypothetical protein AAFQ37_02955, partial [Bacteroidota bacterium]
NKNIPLYVRSFIDPNGTGTLINGEMEEQYPAMVAIERKQALLHISTRDFSFVAEHHINLKPQFGNFLEQCLDMVLSNKAEIARANVQ